MNIAQIRKETLHCEDMIHFNNAGASLPTKYVNEAIIAFIKEEEATGGYEMQDKYDHEISGIYRELARLIKSGSDEISLSDGASTAFSKALYAIPFQAGDEIITSEIEYSSNYLNYLKVKKDKGIIITTIPKAEESPIDLEKLEQAIKKKTRLIAVTHMPTSSGAISPVAAIGKIAKAHNILYLVDTCQSIGHYPTFVDDINCDFLTGTSRKYLRGPRGLGFLYANKRVYEKLDPYMIEATGAAWKSKEHYDLSYTSKMFEAYEKPYGFVMGFKAAVKYANDIGIDKIWERTKMLGIKARSAFSNIEGVQIHDGGGQEKSGIVTLTIKNKSSEEIHSALQKQKVNSSICRTMSSLTDMESKGLMSCNRLSVHYYNTEEEIERVAYILQNIK